MTKELTQTQVEELKQALKDKNNAPQYCRFSHSMRELFYENLMNMP
ncbi:hypothetical protein [Streptococcus sp. FT1-106]